MRKMKLIIGLLFLSCSFTVNATGNQGKPAVFALNATALEKNKARIKSNDPLIMPAYKQLLKEADKALDFGPVSVMEKKNDPPSGDKHDYMSLAPYYWPDPAKKDGLPYIRKDGETNPEVKEYKDKEYMPKLCDVVRTLALAYYFSDNKIYAERASKLLRVWFLDAATRMNPNLNFSQAMKGHNTGRGAGMIDARHFVKAIDAIGLLQGSKSWTAQDDIGMKAWFRDYLHWMQTSENGVDEMHAKNNHGVWYEAQRMSIALYLDSMTLAKQVAQNIKTRIENQIDDKGFLPLEMERTTSLHYSTFAVEAFFIVARMGELTGDDIWNYTSPSGRSLKMAFNTLLPYYAGEKKWEGPQIKEFDLDEAIPLMAEARKKFDCKQCGQYIKNMSGSETERLRTQLLTDTDF